jgi:hypothetical protein
MVPGMTTDDDTKPTGYATLREALAVIIEHEAESARSSTEFGPGIADERTHGSRWAIVVAYNFVSRMLASCIGQTR